MPPVRSGSRSTRRTVAPTRRTRRARNRLCVRSDVRIDADAVPLPSGSRLGAWPLSLVRADPRPPRRSIGYSARRLGRGAPGRSPARSARARRSQHDALRARGEQQHALRGQRDVRVPRRGGPWRRRGGMKAASPSRRTLGLAVPGLQGVSRMAMALPPGLSVLVGEELRRRLSFGISWDRGVLSPTGGNGFCETMNADSMFC